MSKLVEALSESWHGVRITERPNLMRQMAAHVGAPEQSLDGVTLNACLYCKHTERCEAYLEGVVGGDPTFCPNYERFRDAAAVTA